MAKKITITFSELLGMFYKSNEYRDLADTTRSQYMYWLGIAVDHLPKNVRCDKITGALANDVYEKIATQKGTVLANRVLAVCRRVFSFAIRRDMLEVNNPWRKVKTKPEESRRVIWQQKDIVAFLDVAYSDWRTRSVGIIAQMCYEWCQRVGDMRLLTWDTLNFEKGYVKLIQSKRRAQVKIPISNNLLAMLEQQKDALDFQPYVAPFAVGNNNKPYDKFRISQIANQIKNKAGLLPELRLSDLRRSGVTEMVEAGVPMPQIMSVTGHSSPASVSPYIKNSLLSSSKACTLRSVYTGK